VQQARERSQLTEQQAVELAQEEVKAARRFAPHAQ